MNISEALNAAADHIEQHPEKYNFREGYVPSDPGYQACMLGRLGLIAGGVRRLTNVTEVAQRILGTHAEEFYKEIFAHIPDSERKLPTINNNDLDDAAKVAPAMRKVAQRYQGIPGDVLALFAKGEVTPA